MLPAALSVTSVTFVLLLGLTESKQKDFYTFKVVNSRGKLVSLEKYRGSPVRDVPSGRRAAYVAGGLQLQQLHRFHSSQVSLVVNVASECGFTDEHYRDLQQLQRDLGPYHFNVLAFPCNQFGQQEPGSDKEIDSFVRRVYGVSFPLFSKIAVVGTGANNVYKHLADVSGKEPDWNFWKYLIDVNGKVVDAWGPKVSVKEIRPKIAEMVRQIILKKKEEL